MFDVLPAGVVVIPIPIRPDVTVHVAHIPHDLTQAEAEKISQVILALGVGEGVR